MKSQEDFVVSNEPKSSKRYKNDSYFFNESFNKSRIYNLEYRKKPAELVRKDLISAMKLPDHELLNRDDYLLILDSWREEWEKGVQVPVNPDTLPHSVVTHDDLLSSSSKEFNLPKEWITATDNPDDKRHTSSYELDLQDICWLQTVRESDLDLDLSENFLEKVIDLFEQHCALNIKDRQVGIEYDEHIVCDVCQNPDGEDGNEMVFCDLCNICVHQACYGIDKIPDGDWLCRPCQELGTNKRKALCVLCPNVGGALKPTTKQNKWAHVSCVYWVPEAKFLDCNLLEPIEIKSIPNWRWNLICSLCNIRKGAPIICAEKNCRCSYHVTCAFKHKLKMKIVLTDEKSGIRLKSYCEKHSKACISQKKNNDEKINEIDFYARSIGENGNETDEQDELNAEQCEFWKYIDVNQICQEISQIYNYNNGSIVENNSENFSVVKNYSVNQTSLNQIVQIIYEYWKLKRLANYGNSLIKMTFEEKFQEQLKYHKNRILLFRYHLERLRTLTYMVCRREKIKQNWLNTQREIFETTLNIIENPDFSVHSHDKKIISMEHQKLFSKIISHHSIYSKKLFSKATDQNPTEKNPATQLGNTDSAENIEDTTLQISSVIKKKRKSPENSITNSLLKEIKRLKRSPISKQNPYARVYLNSTKSRKLILPNGSNLNEETGLETYISEDHGSPVDSKKSQFNDGQILQKHLSENDILNQANDFTPSLQCSDENGKKYMHTKLQKPIVGISMNSDENENINSSEKIPKTNGDIVNHHFSPVSKMSDCQMIIRVGIDERLPLSQNGNNNNDHHHYKKLRHHDHQDSTETSSLSRKYPLRNKVK
ncbi:E3 ubiquitin-protein ligase Jade-2 [Dermatophagoides pteronyssinus]|uniref:E3 ubiquitin-protein ligase Jade-2 n=1 Tax=Dermatophagoides pteronyssinus TaxID=6956 RepID=A0ABQ8JED3_DERPT|nr:E3 ubiquitin-protein ligase Jade-2 [Dermatophagoides pteronyssinus]